MKKTLLTLTILAILGSNIMAQTVIFDNGPVVNLPGGGLGGADVSHIHDAMNLFGTSNSFANVFRVADEIIIPAGESWVVDSLIFFGYQTGAVPATTTFTDVNVQIWDGDPSTGTATVIFGDDVTNRMVTSDWTGAYRTADFGSAGCPPATCSQRPIMRNATMIGTTLTAGTYWIDWQCAGTLASGPWVPLLNLGVGVTTTGNAIQFNSGALSWAPVTDTVPASLSMEPQGLPFQVVGSILVGLNELPTNQNVTIFPNPVADHASVTINTPVSVNDQIVFKVYDLLGNTVLVMDHINTNTFEFQRGTLTNGLYMYEMLNGSQVLNKGKIVMQ